MAGLEPAIQLSSATFVWMAGSGAGHEKKAPCRPKRNGRREGRP
jgi:hypothetical protein